MPMSIAGNQQPLGEHFYFFESPVQTAKSCLIIAHSGQLMGDGTFRMPPGVTMHFYVNHGALRTSNPRQMIRDGASDDAKTLGDWRFAEVFKASAEIPNYTLQKVVGSGWKVPANGFGDQPVSYHDVQQYMRANAQDYEGYKNARNRPLGWNWVPHVLSVRNRRGVHGGHVRLQDAVDAIRAHDSNIDQFYFGGCREDASSRFLASAKARIGEFL